MIRTRYYNQILMSDNLVHKTCPANKLSSEVSWLNYAKRIIPNNVPHIIKVIRDQNGYSMQKVGQKNLHQHIIKQNQQQAKVLFKKVVSFVDNNLHKANKPVNPEDIRLMYFEKPMESIKTLGGFSVRDLTINGEHYSSALHILPRAYNLLAKKLVDTKYTFIHGDLTLSNIVFNQDEDNFYLIDPRGKFGSTKLYGDVRYDVAKLHYSIAGSFDSLNNQNFKITKNNINDFTYKIENNISYLDKIIFDRFKQNKKLIEYIHASIWLSLMPHLIDNKDQMITAYLHGTVLLNRVYNKISN